MRLEIIETLRTVVLLLLLPHAYAYNMGIPGRESMAGVLFKVLPCVRHPASLLELARNFDAGELENECRRVPSFLPRRRVLQA